MPNDADAPTPPDHRTRFGMARFGDGRVPAMMVAAPAGLVLALALGALAVATGTLGTQPLLVGALVVIGSAAPLTLLVHMMVVDRMTMRGAVARPEPADANEVATRAGRGTMYDIGIVVGIGLMLSAIVSLEIDMAVALFGIACLAIISFAIRYAIVRRSGRGAMARPDRRAP